MVQFLSNIHVNLILVSKSLNLSSNFYSLIGWQCANFKNNSFLVKLCCTVLQRFKMCFLWSISSENTSGLPITKDNRRSNEVFISYCIYCSINISKWKKKEIFLLSFLLEILNALLNISIIVVNLRFIKHPLLLQASDCFSHSHQFVLSTVSVISLISNVLQHRVARI